MSRTLITMPGKFGDIFWVLPAARQLARGEPGGVVDLAMMPRYSSACELLRLQSYIGSSFSIDGWEQEHDNCGAQPMIPPSCPSGYERVFNLGYRRMPMEPLYLEAFKELSMTPVLPLAPFIGVTTQRKRNDLIAYSFNGQDRECESSWVKIIAELLPSMEFMDVGELAFENAAERIAEATLFLGSRSSNYVIAHGVGTRIVTLESIPGRRHVRFSFPWGWEALIDPPNPVRAVEVMRRWIDELT